jgi:peptide chain release factor 2
LFAQLSRQVDDLRALLELATPDDDLLLEWSENLKRLERVLSCLGRMIRKPDRFDAHGACIRLVPTHQDTAAFLWVERLAGMLTHWATNLGLPSEVFHQHPADQGGLEDITLRTAGPFAFGLLRPEMGLHRGRTVNRAGPSPARGTRTVRVTVSPIISETELALDDSEIRWEAFHHSARSQHS